MYNCKDYIHQSLELHLFFGRIMKEHSFFLQLGFTPRDGNYTDKADFFREEFDHLLQDVVALSSGIVSPEVLSSGEVVTEYTLNAEMASAFYTGVQIPTDITKAEMVLTGTKNQEICSRMHQTIYKINERAIGLISSLIQFKANILSNVLSCNMFTVNYPLLIEHIMREAKLYLKMVRQLQKGETGNIMREALEQETFWNQIMAEHAKFIRGLLDPSEKDLIQTANDFGNEFDQLTADAKAAMNHALPIRDVTSNSLAATKKIRNFKAQGTDGIIDCKIKSIILPLLGDHTLREANHYLRLLKEFS